jgi:hypothetical protein
VHIGNIKMALKRKIISTPIGLVSSVPKESKTYRPPYRENITVRLISKTSLRMAVVKTTP